MVKSDLTEARAAERRVALSHAPARARAGLAALLALDAALGGVVRTTREPLVGQMRLTWWHDALAALDERPAPAEPVLQALAAEVIGRDVTGARLATLVEGWEALLDPLDPVAVDRAAERGAALFGVMAALLESEPGPVAEAGRGWAFADLALHLSDPVLAGHARGRARETLDRALAQRWPGRLRTLGALAVLARDDVADTPSPPAGWRRTAAMLRHRLTGR
jgi:15-cis-phytoene synthase